MKVLRLSGIILTVIVCVLGLSCLENLSPPVEKGLLKIVMEGMDHEVEFALPAGVYDIQATLIAGATNTDVVVECYVSGMGILVAREELSFANDDIGTQEGDIGSEMVMVTVLPDTETEVVITFEVIGSVPTGWVIVSIDVARAPNIDIITLVPGHNWEPLTDARVRVEATDNSGNPEGSLSVTVHIQEVAGPYTSMDALFWDGGLSSYIGTVIGPDATGDYEMFIEVSDLDGLMTTVFKTFQVIL